MDKGQASFFIFFDLSALSETTGHEITAISPDKIILSPKSGTRDWKNVVKWPKSFQGHILNSKGKHHIFR